MHLIVRWSPRLVIAFLVAAVVLPLPAMARPPGGHAQDLEARIEQLALDPETQAEVDALFDRAQGERRAFGRDLRAAREAMRELLGAAESDEASLIAQAERISALELERHKRRIAMHLALREVLTPDQMQRLVAARTDGRARGPRFERR